MADLFLDIQQQILTGNFFLDFITKGNIAKYRPKKQFIHPVW
jgi:hypothetical protein